MPKIPARRPLDDFPGEVLTVNEARQVLGVSRDRLYELVRQGQVPHLRLGGIVIPKAALRRWLESSTPGSAASNERRPPLLVIGGR